MSEDWLDRWANNRTGWHEATGNAGLKSLWPDAAAGSRVLVPLCGKTPDLCWLANRGHEVVGVELAERAVRDFFAEQNLEFSCEKGTDLDRYTARDLPITLYCGDYFRFNDAPFDALYDRGALVALPATLRPEYIRHTKSLLHADATRLVITLEYDQSVVNGPPFSVSAAELGAYWSDLVRAAETDDLDTCPPKFRAAGLTKIYEVVWLADGQSTAR